MPRLVGVLLLCVALVACGGSDQRDYRDELPPIDRGLVALGDDVAEGLRRADDATLAARFSGYARRLARLRTRLADLEPPGDVERDHGRLLAAMAAERAQLSAVAAAAAGGDAAAARTAAAGVVREGADLDEARARLVRAVGD